MLVLLKGAVAALHGLPPVVRKKLCPDLLLLLCGCVLLARKGRQATKALPRQGVC